MITVDAIRGAASRLRGADIADDRLEAELLLCHALGLTREALLARLRDPLDDETSRAFEGLIERRLAHEPVAYITGHREFYGLDLACTPDALIPRPETELVVELTLDWVKGHGPWATEVCIVDAGTGNGAIAIAIAANQPDARVVAIDTSAAALRLARRNARAHGVEGRIDFACASLLDAVRGKADVVVANLPYIPTHEYRELAPEVREGEPEQALHAGPRGTELIEALLPQAAALLGEPGLLAAEHGWDQGELLREAARASFPGARIETRRDLAGEERVLVVAVNG